MCDLRVPAQPTYGIVIELCKGGSLYAALRTPSRLPATLDRLRVLAGVATGLAYLHEDSLVHADGGV